MSDLSAETDSAKGYKHNVSVAQAFMKDCETIFTAFYTSKSVIEKYMLAVEKCESDLKTLCKPKGFLDAYPKILREINRRQTFNLFIKEGKATLQELRDIISAEIKERSSFLKTYGEVIPLDFIPQLKVLPTKLPSLDQVLNPDEANLPLICDWVPLDSI